MGLPKFFLKFSVNRREKSLNSGVEKLRRGSSCFLCFASASVCSRISSRSRATSGLFPVSMPSKRFRVSASR